MAIPSKNTDLQFYLNGQEVNAPFEWRDIGLLATFENDNTQANITIDQFDLVLEAREIVLDWIEQGRLFEGIPFQIVATNIERDITVFDGMISLATDLELLDEVGKVRVRIDKNDGLNRLEERIEGLTFGYLYDIGVITDSDFIDVPYVVDPVNNVFDTITLGFMITFLVDQTIQQSQEVATAAANLFAELANVPPTGAIGLAAANFLIQSAKLAALVISLTQLSKQVFNALIEPVRKHKLMRLNTLIAKVCEKIGYSFESDIPNEVVFLASNLNADLRSDFAKLISIGTIKKGIPNANDYGYLATEMFELGKKLINGKYAIQDNTVQLRTKGAGYWQSLADYQALDVLIETKTLNTDELIGDRLFSFDTDIADEYTITDFAGTNYEVITSLKGDVDPNRNLIKGFDNVRFNVCLGSRKEKINPIEEALKALALTFDSVINLFGGRSNLAARINSRTGVLRVSSNQHTKPKVLWLEGGQIPADHKQKLSAKAIENTYYAYDSFVRGEGQKTRYNAVRSGFGLNDFVALIDNRYFRTSQGELAEAERIEWRISADSATFNYAVRKRYTEQLEETFIEG